jgi:hypothetical protein
MGGMAVSALPFTLVIPPYDVRSLDLAALNTKREADGVGKKNQTSIFFIFLPSRRQVPKIPEGGVGLKSLPTSLTSHLQKRASRTRTDKQIIVTPA